MNRTVGLISAAGIGAGFMYLFDPDRGKRRRAEIRNKAKHINCVAIQAAGKTKRDLHNHFLGVVAEIESLVRSEEVADDVLEARVRSKLGRIVSHPHAIEVKVVDGRVILMGPILAAEVVPLVEVISGIAGLKSIENLLELHENAGDVPALQGGKRRSGERFGPFKTTWSPTTRLVAGLTGGALTVYGGKRRGALGSAMATVGLGILTRALLGHEIAKLFGVDRKQEMDDDLMRMKSFIETGVLPHDAAANAETRVHA